MPQKRIKKWGLALLVSALCWLLWVAVTIHTQGQKDQARHADCIIVLGAAVQNGMPSPVFAERLQHAVHLYQLGYAPYLLFTGGIGADQTLAESTVAEQYALATGVPVHAILSEGQSRTTLQNLSESQQVMQANQLQTAILVSDPLHMKRAMMMADDLGIQVVPSPTPTTRYRSWRTKLGFLAREVYFLHHYVLTGQ